MPRTLRFAKRSCQHIRNLVLPSSRQRFASACDRLARRNKFASRSCLAFPVSCSKQKFSGSNVSRFSHRRNKPSAPCVRCSLTGKGPVQRARLGTSVQPSFASRKRHVPLPRSPQNSYQPPRLPHPPPPPPLCPPYPPRPPQWRRGRG